jgi:hypothetical protein
VEKIIDECILEHSYISVVPVQFDLTAHHTMQQLTPGNGMSKKQFLLE